MDMLGPPDIYETLCQICVKFWNGHYCISFILDILLNPVKLAQRSGNVMDCHATARGWIPGRNGVFIELHVLRKGQ